TTLRSPSTSGLSAASGASRRSSSWLWASRSLTNASLSITSPLSARFRLRDPEPPRSGSPLPLGQRPKAVNGWGRGAGGVGGRFQPIARQVGELLGQLLPRHHAVAAAVERLRLLPQDVGGPPEHRGRAAGGLDRPQRRVEVDRRRGEVEHDEAGRVAEGGS